MSKGLPIECMFGTIRGLARADDLAVFRGLHHRVARLPRWPTKSAGSLAGPLAERSAGSGQGRSRWGGHCPWDRAHWFGLDPLRTATRR